MKLTDLLKEIGEGSITPYSYKFSSEDGNIYDREEGGYVIYKFSTEEDGEGDPVEYTVTLAGEQNQSGEYFLDVEYAADDSYGMTNLGKPLKVMATVAAITKEVVEGDTEGAIDGVMYGPADKEGEGFETDYNRGETPSPEAVNQRDRLYRAYIKKALGGDVEFSESMGSIVVRFKGRRGQEKMNEVGEGDVYYRAVMDLWDSSGDFTKKKIGTAVMGKPNATRDRVAKAMRDMDWMEMRDLAKALRIQ